jgi:hypothetical protein
VIEGETPTRAVPAVVGCALATALRRVALFLVLFVTDFAARFDVAFRADALATARAGRLIAFLVDFFAIGSLLLEPQV